MKKRDFVTCVLAIVSFSFVLTAQSASESSVLSSDEIRQILVERLGDRQDSVGIVVGIIEPEGRRIVSHGSAGTDDARSLDGDTVFEIGSITKVFTSLVLADMVERGEVALDDPVEQFLPLEVTLHERNGRSISLEHLSTHSSGLPRVPSNLEAEENPDNPYARYSVDDLYDFLVEYELGRDPGAQIRIFESGRRITRTRPRLTCG